MTEQIGVSIRQMVVVAIFIAGGLFLLYWFLRPSKEAVEKKSTDAKMLLIFLGAPGSGKGTVAERAARELDFVVLSTGNLIRDNIAKGTELGKKFKEYTSKGELVPDELICSMVKEWLLTQAKAGKKIILDGFPRTAVQAKYLHELIKNELKDYKVRLIELQVPGEEAVRRISNRLTCSNKACQAVYRPEDFEKPEEAVCKRCGAKLIKREDDRPEVVHERLRVYKETNAPFIEFYRSVGYPREGISSAGKKPEELFATFKAVIAK